LKEEAYLNGDLLTERNLGHLHQLNRSRRFPLIE